MIRGELRIATESITSGRYTARGTGGGKAALIDVGDTFLVLRRAWHDSPVDNGATYILVRGRKLWAYDDDILGRSHPV